MDDKIRMYLWVYLENILNTLINLSEKCINKQIVMKNKRAEQEEARRKREQARLEEYKKKMMPLVKFMKKAGLRFEHARMGQDRVQYFRLDDWQVLKTKKQTQIEKNPQIRQLLSQLRQVSTHLLYFTRPSGEKKLKYPPVIQPSPVDSAKYASFKFDTTTSRKWMMVGLLVGVLLLVLFPVWPYLLKYVIWLISLYLLVALVGLLVFRFCVYVLCVAAGFDVWIFPNLLGDYGVIESFYPIIHAERWQTNTINIILRLSALFTLGYCGWYIYMDPTILQGTLITTQTAINDIHDWGVEKIKNQVKFSERAISNLQTILNETSVNGTEEQYVEVHVETIEEVKEVLEEVKEVLDDADDGIVQ